MAERVVLEHRRQEEPAGADRAPEVERYRKIAAVVRNAVAMVKYFFCPAPHLIPVGEKCLNEIFHFFLASKGRRASAPNMSKEQLDSELDQYMANTKSSLDKEMDEYMNGINSTI